MSSTVLDIETLRADTPGCRNVLHFNNAGAALMPQPVLDVIQNHLNLEASIGGYEAAREAADDINGVYDSIARLIGADAGEIAITQNATRAWEQAFYAIPFLPRDRILTSVSEYASNYIAYLQIAQKTDAKVEVIPNDETGQLSVEALQSMLDERVRLVAITHVPTNGGLINPAAEVGRLLQATDALYLLDACQSVGQIPVDVGEIGCDFLSATSRKYLRGPRGAGFLYVRENLIRQLEPASLDLHAATLLSDCEYQIRPDARRFEKWEASYAVNLGLGAAVEYALKIGLDTIETRIQELANTLRRNLQTIPGVHLQDQGQRLCGIVSFTVEGKRPAAVVNALNAQRINISWSPANYTLLDMQARQLDGIIRASVHYYNTDEEIQRFCAALQKV